MTSFSTSCWFRSPDLCTRFICRSFCINIWIIWYCYTDYYYYYYYFVFVVSCHRPVLPGTSPEPTTIPTTHDSSFTLQDFPYYVWCFKYSIAPFCSESIECFRGTVSKFFLNSFVTISVSPISTGFVIVTIIISVLSIYREPGELSRYSDSLRAGWSGDRIPVGGEIFRTHLNRPWNPHSGYRVFPGGKAAGVWR